MKRVLTYGTYDLLHYGHIRLLKRARELGDYLIVALSTDEFNATKGKKAYHSYETRKEMIEAVRYVDLVIPEECWEQKLEDVRQYKVDVVVMGGDWEGSDRFDYLKEHCELVYLDRTKGVSTTEIKSALHLQAEEAGVEQIPEPEESRIEERPGVDGDRRTDTSVDGDRRIDTIKESEQA
jgi:glycerol-3-phosphate cytidylyltransferase